MTRNYFSDVLFDLINDSDLLNVYDIQTLDNGYRITVEDGAMFDLTISEASPKDNVLHLFPEE